MSQASNTDRVLSYKRIVQRNCAAKGTRASGHPDSALHLLKRPTPLQDRTLKCCVYKSCSRYSFQHYGTAQSSPCSDAGNLGSNFAFLEDEDTAFRSYTEIQSRQEVQQRLQLRMVCKQFDDVYAVHMHRLNLPISFPTSALPGLLAWLWQSRVSITVFEAICATSVTDVILGAFVLSSAPLRVINVSHVSSCSLELLSAFLCLKQCSLSGQELEDFQDLTPLRNLPNLTDLLLCGDFCGLNMLQHLTSLQLQTSVAKATDICNFASVLQKLILEDSQLHGLHPHGLSACTSLRLLQLSESLLYDQEVFQSCL